MYSEVRKSTLEFLRQQLKLLAEKSKEENISTKDLCDLTAEMYRITCVIYDLTLDNSKKKVGKSAF